MRSDFDYKNVIKNKLHLKLNAKIPADISSHVRSLKKVKRFNFKEYPKNVIKDNTFEHTLKCVYLAENFGFADIYKNITRTLWIHDIPELITNDITVIEKYRNKAAVSNFENLELAAAEKLLNENDRKLLISFNKANNFLKGNLKWNQSEITIDALAAKIIDNSEGNMTYHYYISNWYKSKKFDPFNEPPKDSLTHTFVTNQKFMAKIKQQFPADTNLSGFIQTVMENIRNFWVEVPDEVIPGEIKKFIYI